LQFTDAVKEASQYITKVCDPPWLEEQFINEEIGMYVYFSAKN